MIHIHIHIHDSHTAYYAYQLLEVFHHVEVAKKRKLQLDEAFLSRFDHYYKIEFGQESQSLGTMMESCVGKRPQSIARCNNHIQISFEEAVRGQFDHHNQAHNANVETTINAFIVFGRMKPDM